MSLYFGPDTPVSYTGEIIGKMCNNEISVDECTRLFCDDTPGASSIFSHLRREFQKQYDITECQCKHIMKRGKVCSRKTTNEKKYCWQHIKINK